MDASKLKRYRFLTVLLLCALCLPFSGCSRVSNEIIVYTSVDEIYSHPIFEAFEKETGIHVRAVYDIESQKTVGLANRLRAEKKQPQADLFWSGESSIILSLSAEGVVQEWTAFAGRARVLLVNTQLMHDRLKWPKSIFDLISDYPSGTVAIANPLFGTSATHAAALYAAFGSKEGKRFYEAVQSKFIVLEGNGAVRDQVAAGRIAMGLTDTDDAFSAVKDNKPVEMVFLDQGGSGIGTLVMPNTVAIVTGAPNPGNAALLLEYITSRKTQKALYESGWFDIVDFPEDITSPRFGFVTLRRMDVSLQQINDNSAMAAVDMEELFLK
ncbi:MAG: extracellular solute-binding protein [Oscillospiraceae bacterium]|nr:extracellular solute-binding protein [Oscillospiraceae bacterium]